MSLVDEFELSGAVIAERFAIDRPIAEGGFGLVYRAMHRGFDRPVAVKCLRVPKELTGEAREDFLRRFNDEGRLLFELSNLHAGIVRAIEAGTVRTATRGDVPYLVLEWLEGETLEHVLETRSGQGVVLDLPGIVEYLEPVAQALTLAHERGVVHRDIKPSNIVFAAIMGKSTTKLLDFGIAKVMQDAYSVTSAKTSREAGQAGMFTPAYAAPEQWVTRFGATGPWTDVFSFALVCVELLSGNAALEGPAIPQFLGQCIDEGERPTPRTRGATVSDEVEGIFVKALSVEPADRYANMGELWDELKRVARTMTPDSTIRLELAEIEPGTTIYGEPVGADTVDQKPLAPDIPQGGGGRPKWQPFALGGLVLALVIGVFIWRTAGTEPELSVIAARAPAEGVASAGLGPGPEVRTDGALTILCTPYCTDILVNDKSLGPSPVVGAVIPAGDATVVVRRDARTAKRQRLRVLAGETTEARFDMRP